MMCPSRDCWQKLALWMLDLTALGAVMLLAGWYAQQFQPVVHLHSDPRVTAVTREYVEVRWDAELVIDCPGRVYPALVALYGSETLPDYPFVVEKARKQFARRYPLPEYLVRLHDLHHEHLGGNEHTELRIRMVAKCNPVWETSQWLRVPFEIPIGEL